MTSVSITRRTSTSGPRYVVRFRRGGRAFKAEHAGSFKSLKEARARRDYVAGELAAGRVPVLHPVAPTRLVLLDQFEAFIASRVDVSAKTQSLYRHSRDRLGSLSRREIATLTPADFQVWIAENKDLATGTLEHYFSTIRQVIDFAGVEPNPARSKRVKLPSEREAELAPPSWKEWRQIKAHVWKRSLLPARLIECAALRVSEVADLTFGDIDVAEGRIRVSRARTKRRTAGQRWLPIPAELLDEIAALCPLEDRTRELRVFDLNAPAIRNDLIRACRDAGIAAYTPHDLRHRRVSLWVHQGFDPVTVKTWAGHSKASMSLDVYSHVVIDGEDEWAAFWAAQRSPGAVPVWLREGAEQ